MRGLGVEIAVAVGSDTKCETDGRVGRVPANLKMLPETVPVQEAHRFDDVRLREILGDRCAVSISTPILAETRLSIGSSRFTTPLHCFV